MKNIALTILLLVGFKSTSQVSYNDVAVIINDNSPASIDIGNYFQSARSVPPINMIHVLAPTTEEIDSLQFEQVRAQIENYLIANNLVDSINYLVTTKGVPLKVESSCFDSTIVSEQQCASFDSELTLILGAYSNEVGSYGGFWNPIYGATEHFSRDSSGIYLVTRLDGYTTQDVFNLIDRSGPSTGLNQQSAQAIVDLNNAFSDSAYFMNFHLQPTYDFLLNNSWNVQLDVNNDPLLNQENVFSYIYGGHGSLTNVSLGYTWTKGSIGSMSSYKTATTFDVSTNTSNSFLIADLISEGCTGASGNVDGLFFSDISNSETLISRYLDPVENYNLAESFYMAEPKLSWQGVVIGDPKSSVFIDNFASQIEPKLEGISIYPNPSTGIINVSANDKINSIVVFDMKGAQVKNYDELLNNSVELDLREVVNGIYIIQIDVGGNLIRERVAITL